MLKEKDARILHDVARFLNFVHHPVFQTEQMFQKFDLFFLGGGGEIRGSQSGVVEN
jgi:hypothetical protein